MPKTTIPTNQPQHNSPPTKSVVLITGASSGIGHATAELMNQRGYKVVATSRDPSKMKDLAEQGITTLALDVTDQASMKAVLKQAGPIEVLINNAGYGAYGAVEDVSIEEARAQFEVNIFGLARLTQLVLPSMRVAQRGTIINIASIAGHFSPPLGAWYHASKHAVEALSDSLKQEVAPFGITVAAIEPGVILTEWGNRAISGLERTPATSAYANQVAKRINFLKATTNRKSASSPQVVAQKIVAVVESNNPKFRYPVGHGARITLLVRRFTTDKLFYWLLKQV